MKRIALSFFTFFTFTVLSAQGKTDKTLLNILQKHPDKFASILGDPEKYRVQIVYTQIDRDKKNNPTFKSYAYRLNKDEYFYPASTVKFPACLLALEKLNNLKIKGLDKNSPMLTDSIEGIKNYPPQYRDLSKADSLPTVAHYIKKILLVSDNFAFNRLYEFMGQELFNKNLYLKGFQDLRIVHRLSLPLSQDQNRFSNSISFYKPSAQLETFQDTVTLVDPVTYVTKMRLSSRRDLNEDNKVYFQPKMMSVFPIEPRFTVKLGKGYMTAGKNYYAGDSLVKEPFDFTYKNYYALEDQQAVLRATLFPEAVKPEQRFNLSEDDYKFLYKYMSMSPMESNSPVYRTDTSMYDSYCKFLMFGNDKSPMPKNIRIFNKVGDAYGFLLDNAYIVDFDKSVEFMLSVVIYCNSDGIFNDDKYDYETVGYPFMANLGRVIYDYEVKRKRKVKPDLSKFKLDYSN